MNRTSESFASGSNMAFESLEGRTLMTAVIGGVGGLVQLPDGSIVGYGGVHQSGGGTHAANQVGHTKFKHQAPPSSHSSAAPGVWFATKRIAHGSIVSHD